MLQSRQADPRLYVPLDSAECALGALEMGLKIGCSPVLLAGPRGMGKTLLLRVLAERARQSFSSVRFVHRLTSSPAELVRLLEVLFGLAPARRARTGERALIEALRASSESRTLLLLDDIESASEASLRKLAEIARASQSALSVVVAGSPGSDLPALGQTLTARFNVVLPESLADAEIESLFEALIEQARLSPPLRQRLESVERAEITRAAAGIPGLLVQELARRSREGIEAAPRRLTLVPATPEPTEVAIEAEPEPEPETLAPVVPPRRNLGARWRHVVRIARAPWVLALMLTETVRPTLARAGRGIQRTARAAAIPAAVAVGITLSAMQEPSVAPRNTESLAPAATATPDVNLQINAKPWARVWIDGREIGTTPLRQRIQPGVHQLEAEFPGGERIQRKIDVGPQGRFVSLP